MKANIKLMGDCLRMELRIDPAHVSRCARAEIEIVKIIQGVSTMGWPDGVTMGRKPCGVAEKNEITAVLRELGWDVQEDDGWL